MSLEFEKDEVIIHQVRKHWFVFLVEIFGIIVGIFAPLILVSASTAFPVQFSAEGNVLILFLFAYLVWIFIMWNILFLVWTDYYLDILIVTNKRVIDIEQRGIFNREMAVLRLSKIQDVTVEVFGFIATFLNFGDIHVQTAGQEKEFIVKHIYNPTKASGAINQAINDYKKYEYGIKDIDEHDI